MNTDRDFLRALDEQIECHMEKLERLEKERGRLEAEMEEARDWLGRAMPLREAEAEKAGRVRSTPVPTARGRRFYTMGARDACHVVLRERKRMSKEDLAEELKEGGYQFGTSSPVRVVHFALVNDREVKMDDYPFVEWIGEVS